jgi:hypothetical protein
VFNLFILPFFFWWAGKVIGIPYSSYTGSTERRGGATVEFMATLAIIYFVVLFFLNRTFYRHHLLLIYPCLVVVGTVFLRRLYFLGSREAHVMFYKTLTLVLVAAGISFQAGLFYVVLRNGGSVEELVRKVGREFSGKKVLYYNNYINFYAGYSLDALGYYKTVPDLAIRLRNNKTGNCTLEELESDPWCKFHLWDTLITNTDVYVIMGGGPSQYLVPRLEQIYEEHCDFRLGSSNFVLYSRDNGTEEFSLCET